MKRMADEIRSLCEDILKGDEDRKKGIEQIKEQSEAIRDNTRKFLAASHKFRKETGVEIKRNLLKGREELIKKISALREDFNRKEQEVRADLSEANRLWYRMNETLKSRRTKSLQTAGR